MLKRGASATNLNTKILKRVQDDTFDKVRDEMMCMCRATSN